MKTVLLIDDDELVLKSMSRALRYRGFAVHALSSPLAIEDALVMLRPDVVLTDYRMPWMTGVQVLALAARLAPNAVRCLISGNVDEIPADALLSVSPVQVFAKPVSLDDLFAAIDEAPELEALAG